MKSKNSINNMAIKIWLRTNITPKGVFEPTEQKLLHMKKSEVVHKRNNSKIFCEITKIKKTQMQLCKGFGLRCSEQIAQYLFTYELVSSKQIVYCIYYNITANR